MSKLKVLSLLLPFEDLRIVKDTRSNINLFSKPNYFLLNFPLNSHIHIGVYTYMK
jgi:hypothetical protein